MKNIYTAFLINCLILLSIPAFSNLPDKLFIEVNKNFDMNTLEESIKSNGGRISVKVENYWLLNLPAKNKSFLAEHLGVIKFWDGDSKNEILSLPKESLLFNLLNWKPEYTDEFSQYQNQLCESAGCGCLVSNDEYDETIRVNNEIQSSKSNYLMCYGNPWELCDTDNWKTVLENLDILKIYIGDINERADIEKVRCLVEALIENDIKIAIELGGLLDWHAFRGENTAEFSFEQDYAQIKPLIDIIQEIDPNRSIDILEFDGPIRRMLMPNNSPADYHTIETAVTELFKVIEMWQEEIPTIQINLITNFPNWAWGDTPAYFKIAGRTDGYGQYMDVLAEINKQSLERKIRFNGITIDNPYDYATGVAQSNQEELIKDVDWMQRILELESELARLRLASQLIFNTNGARNSEMYYNQTLEFIDLYKSKKGQINDYWIQSWYEYPEEWIPEDKEFTMTNLVRDIMLMDSTKDVNPNITSDIMQGSSVAIVFFVQNINHAQTNAPHWNDQNQAQAMANIVHNLAWWTDQAEHYGIEKTFEVLAYYYDNPISQINFDPTIGYVGLGDKDHLFQNVIMNKLGYNIGNHTNKMRTFAHNTRLEYDTDWAFLAFILTGKENVRAHASYNGPSTVLMNTSTQTGFTFTHEVGHIYGASDEYWEAAYALGRQARTRFGVPNGNFHWRNYPVQPSMMASTFSGGISYYTAVHLGLTDKVQYTHIETYPPNAPYKVTYYNNLGNVLATHSYKGNANFHWGAGMTIRLSAPEETAYNGYIYNLPQWSENHEKQFSYNIIHGQTKTINLNFSQSNEKAESEWYYFTVGDALAGQNIQTVSVTNQGVIGFGGMMGISVWDGETREIIDYEFDEGRAKLFRESYDSDFTSDGALYFASHGGEILKWHNGNVESFKGSNADLTYKILVAGDDGTILAAEGASGRTRDEISAMGLHKWYSRSFQDLTSLNSNLPSNYVSAISKSSDGNFWVGFGRTPDSEEANKGLYSYDNQTSDFQKNDVQPNESFIKQLTNKDGINTVALTENSLLLLNEQGIYEIDLKNISPKPTIFDVVYRNNRFAVATNSGLWVYAGEKNFREYNVSNSEIISNFCYSVDITPNGDFIIGTNMGAALLKMNDTTVSVLENPELFTDFLLLDIYPNPTSDIAMINYYIHSDANVYIEINDVRGLKITEVDLGIQQAGFQDYEIQLGKYHLPSGIYFLTININGKKLSKQMVYQK